MGKFHVYFSAADHLSGHQYVVENYGDLAVIESHLGDLDLVA